jgi:hypothetical protein
VLFRSAFGLGTSTLANTTGQVSNIFGNSLQQSGNVASFNTNMLETRRNTILNNNAAIQGAAMQSAATGQAGMMGMVGSLGGAAIGAVGLAAF